MPDQILVLDFGSQFTQLIARRVRELNVYCEIHPFNKIPAITPEVKGVILSGSPCSVRDAGAPDVDLSIFGNIPVLGVCYGAQLIAHRRHAKNRQLGIDKMLRSGALPSSSEMALFELMRDSKHVHFKAISKLIK